MATVKMTQQHVLSGLFGWLKNIVAKRPKKLQYFYDLAGSDRIAASHFLGCQDIDLSKIVGSMNAGRCADFDGNFQLLKNHSKERLAQVDEAWQRMKLPPISLVQLGEYYFVQDGHHRVSIATTKGDEMIAAQVTAVTLTQTGSGTGLTSVHAS